MGVGTGAAARERRPGEGERAPSVEIAQGSRRQEPLTRFHQRIAAEVLTARSGQRRLPPGPGAGPAPTVDLNPHQIEAAAFALASLPTGGAVLADEVGLGKTVEAGLVLAQLAAEGRGRAVDPGAGLAARAVARRAALQVRPRLPTVVDGDSARAAERQGAKANPFDTGGIVIASHPFAALRADEVARVPWDVAVIDEAHRLRNAWRRDHRTGQALRKALRKCPKLLLTATPLQNDLMELLGLTAFLDDTLLGTEDAFRLQLRHRRAHRGQGGRPEGAPRRRWWCAPCGGR